MPSHSPSAPPSRRTSRAASLRAIPSTPGHAGDHQPPIAFRPTALNNAPMARFGDVVPVLRSVGIFKFFRRVGQQANEDNIFVWAAALAYSWLFSVFPFLIFLLSLVPYLPPSARDSARNNVREFIHNALGNNASVINDNIKMVTDVPHGGWLSFGLILSLWVASGGMMITMSALDQCYDIKKGRPWYIRRPLAMLLTVFIILFVMVIFILLPVGTVVELWVRHIGGKFSNLEIICFNIARYTLAALLMMMLLTLFYHFGPSIRQRFTLLSPGAAFSLVGWILMNLFFRFYIDHYSRYDQTYGAVGGVAILLLFFYLDALVLLLGAEVNSELDFQRLGVASGSKDFTGPPKTEPAT
jgi:membrane protein